MKNTKLRLVALVLALIMCFAVLASCGGKDGDGDTVTTTGTAANTSEEGTYTGTSPVQTAKVDDLYFEPDGDFTFEDLCEELKLDEEEVVLFKLLCNGMTVAQIRKEIKDLEQLDTSIYELLDQMKTK